MEQKYLFEESKDVITPALVYYLDIIRGISKKQSAWLAALRTCGPM